MRYVLMAIPIDLVPKVADLIAGFHVEPREGGSPAAHESSSDFVNGWSEATIRQAYLDSADAMRKVLRLLAEHPDEEVTSDDIAEWINAEHGWNTVAGMLGAFGRRSANRYGRRLPMWHIRYSDDERTLVRMPAAVAQVITTVADE